MSKLISQSERSSYPQLLGNLLFEHFDKFQACTSLVREKVEYHEKTYLKDQRYTNAGLKICQCLRLQMMIICRTFHIKPLFTF